MKENDFVCFMDGLDRVLCDLNFYVYLLDLVLADTRNDAIISSFKYGSVEFLSVAITDRVKEIEDARQKGTFEN